MAINQSEECGQMRDVFLKKKTNARDCIVGRRLGPLAVGHALDLQRGQVT